MLDLLLKPSFGIPFVPECLLMVLYHYVVHIIVRNRSQFKPSFVVLIVLGCIMNTLAFGNSFITARVPRNTAENDTFSDFFKSHDIVNNIENFSWIQISHTLHYSFAYSQYFYHSFFCLNRFIGIAFPKNCEKIWKKSFWPVVIIIFFVPVLIVHRILFGRSFYRMGENGDFFWIDSTYSRANIYTIMVPATSFCTVFNISVNIICYLKIRRKERESHSDQRLRKMILVCLLIDSSLLILTFCNFYLNVWSSVKESPIFSGWVFFMIPYASDVLTLSTPLQLLLFSKNIRRMCIENVPYLRHYKGHTFFNHTTQLLTSIVSPIVPQFDSECVATNVKYKL
ncbi:Protein CBG24690 [Caenorhabditis briggsae]|uniref:Serpentine receptor class gamma n=1 Tax=Caenorhabditis briggsae TaxID=6238 RepID=A8WL95_CAEBR|nr:Protein CBG24690 [Caenorhabditis briggsae]CAP21239.2 Protein CBG24690 [Caenorhabditis briggsae]